MATEPQNTHNVNKRDAEAGAADILPETPKGLIEKPLAGWVACLRPQTPPRREGTPARTFEADD